ncbi:hypothetical protein GFS24_03680 [Chitinophaga sp. SYP-B3965]|uniref:hypothetical protein n=1 Tax=Chitinophaga sp. SYP-B3965 TaxID=2663120 RepID=UPI001299A9F8|nr:hypothetical protein [Chitinophaga sp. SYP-B3965]MRG44197.1 hypothetical protein [Chitinophaga sp. SYP-B3965]
MNIYFAVPFLALLFIGCNSPEPKFGKEYNSRRTRLGLQKIPDDWKVYAKEEGYEKWENPKMVSSIMNKKAFLSSITTHYDGEIWISEEDLLISGKMFNLNDEEIPERIQALYTFVPMEIGVKKEQVTGWYFSYTGAGAAIRMNAQQVDSALKAWGLDYRYVR